MNDLVKHINESNFEQEVVQSDLPVLVDFWAPWCGPCKMIAPVIEQLAQTYEGRAKVVKIDVEQFPQLAKRFNVRNIPALMVLKKGEVQASQVGAVPASAIAQMLDKTL